MEKYTIDTYLKAKIAVYYYSIIGDSINIDLLLTRYNIKPIGLGFAVYYACKYGHIHLVKKFKKYIDDMDPNPILFLDKIQLHTSIMAAACYSGNIQLVDFLMYHGSKLTTICLNKICKIKNSELRTQMIGWILSKITPDNYESALINLMKNNDTYNTLYILCVMNRDAIKKIIINLLRFAAYMNNCQVFDWIVDNFDISDYIHTIIICIRNFLMVSNYEAVDKLIAIKNVFHDPLVIDFFSESLFNHQGIKSFDYIYQKCNLDIRHQDYRIIRCYAESGNLLSMKRSIDENKKLYNLDITINQEWKQCLEHCFRLACYYNHIKIAKYLIDLGIDPNSESDYISYKKYTERDYIESNNALILAAKNDNIDIIYWLLSFIEYQIEIIEDAIIVAAEYSKSGKSVEILAKKITDANYRFLYISATKNNAHVMKLICDLYSEKKIRDLDIEILEFTDNEYTVSKLECIKYLEYTHQKLSKDIMHEFINLKMFKKDLLMLLEYIDHYEYEFKKEECQNDLYHVILFQSLFEIEDYFMIKKIDRYNYFSDGLKNLIIHDFSEKLLRCENDQELIYEKYIKKTITSIMSDYSHFYDRYDFDPDFYYDDYILYSNKSYIEPIENIKLLDFYEKHNLAIDYYAIFDEILLEDAQGDFIICKDKISIDYVSKKVTYHFEKISNLNLYIIRKLFDGFYFKKFPFSEKNYSKISLDKIKFLLNYFNFDIFFDEYQKSIYFDTDSILYLLNVAESYNEYNKLAKKIFKSSWSVQDAIKFIDALYEKDNSILNTCLNYSIYIHEIEFLDYLVQRGAKIPLQISLDKFYYRDIIKRIYCIKVTR